MKRQTKIICTLGPASSSPDVVLKMAQNGMDVARLNFSHGSHEIYHRLIETIRRRNARSGFQIKILQDLEGYRIRVGHLARPVELKKGAVVHMVSEARASGGLIPLDLDPDIKAFRPGMSVFIDDGLLALEVVAGSSRKLSLRVLQGGWLKSRKGVNIPDLKLDGNILTPKDREDIRFGIEHKVDYIAQSFVRNRADIQRVCRLAQKSLPECKVFAKIENKEGVRNLDAIMDASDGIMIARGDLGVSLPIYKIPVIQKGIIRRCNKKKKYSITATQMLESMTENNRPTRAEVSDVANAILDGTDYVMLSAETAAGLFPVECVGVMRQIVEYTEGSLRFRG